MFLPHKFCLGSSGLIIVHVIADLGIFVAYMLISSILYYFRQHTALFRPVWVTLAFATFIFSCGTTHLMDVLVLWIPTYRLQAVVKMVCAVSSLATAAAMPHVFRTTIKLRKDRAEEDVKGTARERS